MNSPGRFSICPLMPSTALTVIGNAIPANACIMDKCAWFLTSVDQRTGKVVAGNCAMAVAAGTLAQLAQMVSVTATRAPGSVPVESPLPPKAS